jgi:hypothetical protein
MGDGILLLANANKVIPKIEISGICWEKSAFPFQKYTLRINAAESTNPTEVANIPSSDR